MQVASDGAHKGGDDQEHLWLPIDIQALTLMGDTGIDPVEKLINGMQHVVYVYYDIPKRRVSYKVLDGQRRSRKRTIRPSRNWKLGSL
jgi:hypothetical protein